MRVPVWLCVLAYLSITATRVALANISFSRSGIICDVSLRKFRGSEILETHV